MDQNEKLNQLTIILAHSQIKVAGILKNFEKFLFARRWKNVLYILIEVFFYFVFLILVVCALLIPNNPLEMKEAIGHNSKISIRLENENFTAIIIAAKLMLFACSIGFLFAAIFSRKARRRGYLIKDAAMNLKSVSAELNSMM